LGRNGNHLTPEKSEALHKRLLAWNEQLDNALRVHGQTSSAVYVLQFVFVHLSRSIIKLILVIVCNTTPLSSFFAGLVLVLALLFPRQQAKSPPT